MRLLTNVISVGLVSKGVEPLPAAMVRGVVVLDNGSYSKIGGPDLPFRYAIREVHTMRRLTAQLVIVTLASVDMEEDGAFE